MTLHVHRSQRVEELVLELDRALTESYPDDPFEPMPIVVGSRGMERWLRHELATLGGSCARVDFLFPRTAFEGAARWLGEGAERAPRAVFWQTTRAESDWSGPRLALRVLVRLRARLGEASFARVSAYLGEVGDTVQARELAFASEVASTLERLMHDRASDAVTWARAPASAPAEHAWLAALLHDLSESISERSPAHRLEEVQSLSAQATGRALFVFGLSTLGPGDRARLAALARHLEVHLFTIAPSSEWWQDIRKKSEQRAALKEAKSAAETRAVLAELEQENALLTANGAPSRELQKWLEAVGYEEPTDRQPFEPAPSLLGRLHRFIERAESNPRAGDAPWSESSDRASIQLHACHGALRQCEALRDELLRRFAEDATLEPRHVLVMTPDLPRFAPLVAAVLSRRGSGEQAIPLSVADLGVRATNPVADALLRALALSNERVTASRLLELLSLAPGRARFSIDDADLADLGALVRESGMRWAWDARDRARHAQPELAQNTVRFGLERLALGVLMHDPSDLEVVQGAAHADLPPAVPLDLGPSERVARFGKLAQVLAELEAASQRASEPASAEAWRVRLHDLLDRLTAVGDEATWLRMEVDEALGALLPSGVADELRFECAAILWLLGDAFELSRRGDRPATGAVTVSSLEPMRSVPFRVIAILGLDDGVFPRPAQVAAWDPFALPRDGELDRRSIDRHLFLEALLCARDALLLFSDGFEPKHGEASPPSVVVSELAELIAAGTGREAEALALRHPLQPWSEDAFRDAERLPFDALWAEAARAASGERRLAGLPATTLAATWPEEESPPASLSAEQLASALVGPQRELLERRLGIRLEAADSGVPDREPLEQEGLDAWKLRARLLESGSGEAAPDVTQLEARLRGEGLLPLGAGGRRALEQRLSEVATARKRADELPGGPTEPLHASVTVDGLVVTATANDVRWDGEQRRLVWLTGGKSPSDRSQLIAWITLLVAVAAGESVGFAHLVGHETNVALAAPAGAEAAAERLAALVEVWRALRQSPLPLFPALSRALIAEKRRSPAVNDAALVRGRSGEWTGSPRSRGELDDLWVSALFGHLTIDDLAEDAERIVRLAATVWLPLLDAQGSKQRRPKEEGA